MIQNTLKNKERFFCLYWGQEIARHTDLSGRGFVTPLTLFHIENYYLELRPLSDITDEEAIEFAKEAFGFTARKVEKCYGDLLISQWKRAEGNEIRIYFDTGFVEECDGKLCDSMTFGTPVDAYDYLRRLGFALPFEGASIKTLIEWGWVKLKKS